MHRSTHSGKLYKSAKFDECPKKVSAGKRQVSVKIGGIWGNFSISRESVMGGWGRSEGLQRDVQATAAVKNGAIPTSSNAMIRLDACVIFPLKWYPTPKVGETKFFF